MPHLRLTAQYFDGLGELRLTAQYFDGLGELRLTAQYFDGLGELSMCKQCVCVSGALPLPCKSLGTRLRVKTRVYYALLVMAT